LGDEGEGLLGSIELFAELGNEVVVGIGFEGIVVILGLELFLHGVSVIFSLFGEGGDFNELLLGSGEFSVSQHGKSGEFNEFLVKLDDSVGEFSGEVGFIGGFLID